jgi:hypothetical protein
MKELVSLPKKHILSILISFVQCLNIHFNGVFITNRLNYNNFINDLNQLNMYAYAPFAAHWIHLRYLRQESER